MGIIYHNSVKNEVVWYQSKTKPIKLDVGWMIDKTGLWDCSVLIQVKRCLLQFFKDIFTSSTIDSYVASF